MGRTVRVRKRKKRVREQFVKPEFNVAVVKLVKWMKTRGLDRHLHASVFTQLKTAVFPETGRGIITTKDIECGETIMSIPASLFITRRSIFDSQFGHLIRKRSSKLVEECVDSMDLFAIFLMFEKLRGTDSVIQQYIQTLPTTYTTPHYFPENKYNKLPLNYRAEVVAQRLNFMKRFDLFKVHFVDLFTKVFSSSTHWPKHKWFELFCWAWCTANTRCVYVNMKNGDDSVAMIPFFDFLNHSPQAKVTAKFNASAGTFDIISNSKISKYSQVYICYGDHCNRKLLMEYGFTVSCNPNDVIPVDAEEIITAVLQAKGKEKINSIFMKTLTFIKEKGFMGAGMGCTSEGFTWSAIVSVCALLSENCLSNYRDILNNVTEYSDREEFRLVATLLLQKKLEEYEQLLILDVNDSCDTDDMDSIITSFVSEERSILKTALSLYHTVII